MKIVCLDGVENSGKTFTLNKLLDSGWLEENKIKYECVHFPSEELCNTDIFYALTLPENSNNIDLKMEFIESLIEEEYLFLDKCNGKNVDIVFIDRFLFSSLIYQGSGASGAWDMEKVILQKYEELLSKLDISTDNFYNFLFLYEIYNDHSETNEAKIRFDSMNNKMYNRFNDLLYGTRDGVPILQNDLLLKNKHVFVDYEKNKLYTELDMYIIGENRVLEIINIIKDKK